MGDRAVSVTRERLLAVAALAALGLVETVAPHLPDPGTAAQIVWVGAVAIPLATAAVTLVADPPPPRTWLAAAIVAGIAASAALIELGYPTTPATITKLVAAGGIGLLLGSYLRARSEVIAVALVIAVVDIASVAAGPTHEIVAHHPKTLDTLTLNVHPMGSFGVAQIGASDLVFFAFFTASAVTLGLRRAGTWAAMTASFGATLALAYIFDLALPALPLLSLAFLVVNADLLRGRPAAAHDSPKRE